MSKYKTISIGIDQSYENTGISISADGELLKVKSKRLSLYNSNSDKRRALRRTLKGLLSSVGGKSDEIVCVIERIRLQSQGFININYIKSIGALNSVIVDVMSDYGIKVYSVDTRCWKAQVVGTSKPMPNKFGVPNEKWPTVKWLIAQGWEEDLLVPVSNRRTKGIFIRNGQKYEYNNDAADSAGISLFWFKGDKDKLQLEV